MVPNPKVFKDHHQSHATISLMNEDIRGVTWEAPEHNHNEKNADWFWALGIIALSATAAAVVFSNILFAAVILLGAATISVVATRKPKIMPFAVTTRGIRVGNDLYPYSTLDAFYIDEDNVLGPQLLARSQHMFMPLIIVPIPEEHIDDIDDIISVRLQEEHLEEPFSHKLLEFLGF